MGLFDFLKKPFARPASVAPRPTAPVVAREPVPVREIAPAELMAMLRNGNGRAPFLLDCREDFERRQGYIPGSIHIAMREIPYHLGDLARDRDIVVYCAHGHRSHDVAGWLNYQGFAALSLRGGIVDWQLRGGEVTREAAVRPG